MRNNTHRDYFFSADWHAGHRNILKYCDRPFATVDEMNHALITNHNEVVGVDDYFIHVGDFTLASTAYAEDIIRQLNGQKIFLVGSHDYWMTTKVKHVWEKQIENEHLFASHYPHHSWPRSHYNSWHIFGHHHGSLKLDGKRYDVGVDNNNYYPVSFNTLKGIMSAAGNNFGLVKTRY